MNFRNVSKYSLLFLLAVSSWIPVLVINRYYWATFSVTNYPIYPDYLPVEVRSGAFAAFIVAHYYLIYQLIRRIEKWDVIDLLWKLLVIGISGISLFFAAEIAEDYTQELAIYPLAIALSASVKLYAFLVFTLSTLFVFRKLILYQRNKRKLYSWNFLQATFILAIARLFLGLQPNAAMGGGNFDFDVLGIPIADLLTSILLPCFLVITLILSANVNWSAYLNFNQKLRSLFLLFVIILLFIAFFHAFPYEALPEARNYQELLSGRYLIFGLLFIFPVVYALLSGLVLIFNLQTSSVFEQRNIELATIQRINQSIQSNLDTDDILRTLLDASLLTSNATGGWIETFPEGTKTGAKITYVKNVSREEIEYLRSRQNLSLSLLKRGRHIHIRNLRKHKNFRYAKTRLRSLLAIPIQTQSQTVGLIYLVNELSNSFEEETIVSLVSMTEQSGISIQNAELVERSIDLEIYREQLKIAKSFQSQILPQELPQNERIRFYAKGEEVDEIGGDFYDVTELGDIYKVAMGDVSGKGTTAAFYMAETKGIFQALTRTNMGVRDFVMNANMALSNCLAKGSFMTLTYLEIDLNEQTAEIMRAGHCQTLFYRSATDELLSLESGGLGLAIVRNQTFGNFLPEPEKISFEAGDFIVLFTDGIIEAHNDEREEFGFERMRDIVYRMRKERNEAIADTLVQQVKAFTGGVIADDYSMLVIKFL